MISVAPTLELMADIYSRSTTGGPESERFAAYVQAGRAGSPVHGYNPMTSKPVSGAVEDLIAIGAEERLERLANETLARLGHNISTTMHITVATPGMWTDRLATEIEHRLLAQDPRGVLWWFDDDVEVERVESEIVAQVVRCTIQLESGAPDTLDAAVRQEGLAAAMAGDHGSYHPAAAEALGILGSDTSLATKVAFLYGDTSARRMGFTPVGLPDRVGYEHAGALGRSQ